MGKDVELDEEAEEVTGPLTLDEASLIDVTEVARKAGFIYPVKVSRSLYERCLTIRSNSGFDTVESRLWMFLFSIRRHDGEPPEIGQKQWACSFTMNEGWYIGLIKVVRRGDVEANYTLTFMLPTD